MMSAKTVAFFGASGGVGLSALKQSLAAGSHCVALCRNPAKLTALLDPKTTPNLDVVQGNAHDVAAVTRCIKASDGNLVDKVVFTIGGKFVMSKMGLDDANVCERGIDAVLKAIADLRQQGATGRPHIIVFSTTGLSRFARDVPLAMMPLYHIMLKVPHADKRAMEDKLVASGETFNVVRASALTDGETDSTIRVGVEDPKTGIESKAIGYTISREDAGKWVGKNLVVEQDPKHANKTLTITY